MISKTSLTLLFVVISSLTFAQQSRFKKDSIYGVRASIGLKIAGTVSHLTYSGKDLNQPTPRDYGSKVNVFPALVLQLSSRKRYSSTAYDFQLSFRNPGTFKASEVDNSSGAPVRYDYTVAAKYLRLEFGARYIFMRANAIRPYVRPLIGVQYTASQSASYTKISKLGVAAGISAGVSTKYVDFELGFDVSRVPVKVPLGGRFSYDLGADLYKTFYVGVVAKPFM